MQFVLCAVLKRRGKLNITVVGAVFRLVYVAGHIVAEGVGIISTPREILVEVMGETNIHHLADCAVAATGATVIAKASAPRGRVGTAMEQVGGFGQY